ncbi:cytochrome c oxidase subunit NDUFA4 [Hyposmocoma kahamanoa]|uniref:cytochrome c oxidase subunit NDUFA4 n=1 Tax=Hyposmocoma kahamanoa TaxID=1477025 RepID=UPI000E6D6FBD|nr:cytochrome c oxidase subunit NDUFA4 [Hyposmocoma kahamanoa]
MQGLSIQSLKKHKALIPLYVCTALGCGGALFYLTRLALRSPDVSWNKRTNPEPWQEYRAKQYKFYSPLHDSKEESPAPKF